jgi:hypothetical protein
LHHHGSESERGLEGVPAQSEAILTAEKAGFLSRAIPVTTGQWDQQPSAADLYQLSLFRREAYLALAPNADLNRGHLLVMTIGSDLNFLPGVRVRTEPAVSAPIFARGGVAVRDATASLENTGTPPAQGGLPSDWVFALFTNLPQGEYAVRTERDDQACGALIFGTDTWYAYPDRRPNVLRALRRLPCAASRRLRSGAHGAPSQIRSPQSPSQAQNVMRGWG